MLSQHVIHERSSILPINKNLTTPMKINSPTSEYCLKKNFFDPTKSSPPNDFMIKLHMRMSKYYFDNKDDSFEIK
jgi:hypothetical protein